MTQPKGWPFTIISEYTLNQQHLADAFIKHGYDLWNFLDLSDEEYPIGLSLYESLTSLASLLECNDSDEIGEALDYLMDDFSSLCPEGYYFGANPDDGACFGYWKIENEMDDDY